MKFFNEQSYELSETAKRRAVDTEIELIELDSIECFMGIKKAVRINVPSDDLKTSKRIYIADKNGNEIDGSIDIVSMSIPCISKINNGVVVEQNNKYKNDGFSHAFLFRENGGKSINIGDFLSISLSVSPNRKTSKILSAIKDDGKSVDIFSSTSGSLLGGINVEDKKRVVITVSFIPFFFIMKNGDVVHKHCVLRFINDRLVDMFFVDYGFFKSIVFDDTSDGFESHGGFYTIEEQGISSVYIAEDNIPSDVYSLYDIIKSTRFFNDGVFNKLEKVLIGCKKWLR